MKIFIERPIATAMLFLALMVLGIYSYLNIPIELAPSEVEFPQLNINTSWRGMPPEIIQTQLTSPLEEKISTVKGVRKIESSSMIGRSQITLEFEEKTNMEFARLALREKIAELKEELPYGIKPNIEPYIPDDIRVRAFLEYTISGDYSLQKLRELVKDKLEIGLGSIKGVAGVVVQGGSDPEIRIILDEKKLKSLKIQPRLVNSKIQESLRIYKTSRVKKGSAELLFKVTNPVRSIREIGEIIIMHSGDNPIKLKDIAKLVPAFADINHINRINGQPTISLTIYKEKGVNTLKTSKKVKAKLEEIKQAISANLIFRTVSDNSEDIEKNLNQLYLLIGVIVVIIFILIFLVLRRITPSFLVLSSIFFSVMLTFNLVYLTKISLNMFTLGGLALGFGLFVDNSIVVFENVLRMREKGLSAIEAAVQGSKEVFLPVFAATLTTMSVFFSMAYFQGRMRLIYIPLAIVISSALAASLLVSFSVIPALSSKLLKSTQKKPKERYLKYYEKFLKFCLKHPLEVLLIITVIFLGSYKWFRAEVTLGEFFSWYSKEELRVTIGMPSGAEIEQTDEVITQFEEKILEKTYEKKATTRVTQEYGFIRISFPTEIERSYRPYILKEELIQIATNFAGININISGFDPQGYYSGVGGGTWYDSQIKFFGYNLKKLQEITSALARTISRNPRIKDWRITSSRWGWWRGDSFEYILKIDKEALNKYNINPEYLYYQINSFLRSRGQQRLSAKIGGKELDLSIKFPEAEKMNLKELEKVLIQTQNGEYLRLAEVSHLEEKAIAGSIDRENQQFQQTLMWEFRGPYKAGERYRKAIFEKLELPPGFSATIEDDRFMTREEKSQIKFAVLFSLIIIFMILASLYESFIQPFFILIAVPLALIGVFVAFVIADFSFDSSAYIGVILLGGIVVNNAILLVDHINLKRKQGLDLYDAVVEGARERIRPIFLTSATTVVGMLPLILVQLEEGGRKIWSSLALCEVGGLISSTMFIIIIIPIVYYYGDRLRYWGAKKVNEMKKSYARF